uniref:PH domain-containing protein n=1 Tax=Ectopseudomonas mendocina (strain ymp) TaxID=399739 RepID=A4XZH0_ECTM1
MTPAEREHDAQLAEAYWATRERKTFAVDMAAGDGRKTTYHRTIYVRASTAQEATDWAREHRSMFNTPKQVGFRARLAGPMELGCTAR